MQTDRTAVIQGLVSIITPAFNEASCISDTVASVVNQSYTNWELLIADDGSSDDTTTIVERFARSDSRIRLLSTPPPNGLAARARNFAMQNARGEFFAFLDADDLWVPKKLATQVEYLNQQMDVAGVCSRYDYIGDPDAVMLHENLKNPLHSPSQRTDRVCTKKDAIRSCPFLTSTVMLRRSCFDQIGGMDEDSRLKSGQDYEYFARLVARFTFHRMPQVLTHYRLQSAAESLSASQQVQKNIVGWNIYNVLLEKGYYTADQARRKRGYLYFDQAKNNLFRLDGAFRASVLRSMVTLRPPKEAIVLMLLLWLPRKVLIAVLTELISIRNRVIA